MHHAPTGLFSCPLRSPSTKADTRLHHALTGDPASATRPARSSGSRLPSQSRKGLPMNRRQLLRGSAAARDRVSRPRPRTRPAGPGRPGANDRIRLGFIGLGGRARWILTGEALPGAEVVAVADCYLPRCHEAAKAVPGGEKWKPLPELPEDAREGEARRRVRRDDDPRPGPGVSSTSSRPAATSTPRSR